MPNGFNQIKKHLWISAIWKSGLLAISLGTFSSALYILMQKILTNSVSLPLPILTGVGCAVVVFAAMLLLLMPLDKRLAKRLDRDLKLGEKAQTMLQHRDDEGVMIEMQREDTNARLIELAPAFTKPKHIYLNFIAPVLAVAILLPTILLPLKAAEAPPVTDNSDPFVEATDWQKTAVAQLIEYVETSNLEDAAKVEVIASLEELLTYLDNEYTEADLQQYVISVIVKVNAVIVGINTFDEISLALTKSENEYVKALGAALGSLNALTLKQELEHIEKNLAKDEIAAFAGELTAILDTVTPVDGDVMLPALIAFAEKYTEIATEMDKYTDAWISNNIKGANDALYSGVSVEMQAQKENDTVRKYVIRRLVEIFNIPDELIPEDIKLNLGTNGDDYIYGEEEDKDETLNSGGLGDGNQIFGSNDTVYDPVTNTHVPYGEILNAYYTKVTEQLLAGGVSDTLADFMRSYFDSLYDGSKNEDDN